MRIGIDLDNTIVCYDGIFHTVAAERGLIPAGLPITKGAVRDHLRATGQEDVWTELQGFVYGPGMGRAEAFPGVWDFIRACSAHDVAVCVISHKTQLPFRGPAYDLHTATRDWIRTQAAAHGDVLDAARHVHLELTKADKLARIAQTGCDWFIDDLPEFLAEPGFPAHVRPVLFDPSGVLPLPRPDAHRATSWNALRESFFGPSARMTAHG